MSCFNRSHARQSVEIGESPTLWLVNRVRRCCGSPWMPMRCVAWCWPAGWVSRGNWPIHYEVDYGPVAVESGRLRISELPARARYPIECRLTAYQIGRLRAPAIGAAEPVSGIFRIVAR